MSPTADSQCDTGDLKMKKAKQGRGFWSWLMGHGWDNAGNNG